MNKPRQPPAVRRRVSPALRWLFIFSFAASVHALWASKVPLAPPRVGGPRVAAAMHVTYGQSSLVPDAPGPRAAAMFDPWSPGKFMGHGFQAAVDEQADASPPLQELEHDAVFLPPRSVERPLATAPALPLRRRLGKPSGFEPVRPADPVFAPVAAGVEPRVRVETAGCIASRTSVDNPHPEADWSPLPGPELAIAHVEVDAEGRVAYVVVEKPLSDPALTERIVRALYDWRLAPGEPCDGTVSFRITPF